MADSQLSGNQIQTLLLDFTRRRHIFVWKYAFYKSYAKLTSELRLGVCTCSLQSGGCKNTSWTVVKVLLNWISTTGVLQVYLVLIQLHQYRCTKMVQTSTTVEDNSEDIESLDADVEMLKQRNIKLEAYTRRENIRIFNIKEEPDENVEERVRSLFVTKLQIPPEAVKAIRFERVHRISTKTSSQRSQSRPRSVIARFSHYQDKEFVRSFYKNLKGTDIGISDDFPKEIEDIHKTLYPVLKKAKRDEKKAFLNFDKLIINGQLYRGRKPKIFPTMETS